MSHRGEGSVYQDKPPPSKKMPGPPGSGPAKPPTEKVSGSDGQPSSGPIAAPVHQGRLSRVGHKELFLPNLVYRVLLEESMWWATSSSRLSLYIFHSLQRAYPSKFVLIQIGFLEELPQGPVSCSTLLPLAPRVLFCDSEVRSYVSLSQNLCQSLGGLWTSDRGCPSGALCLVVSALCRRRPLEMQAQAPSIFHLCTLLPQNMGPPTPTSVGQMNHWGDSLQRLPWGEGGKASPSIASLRLMQRVAAWDGCSKRGALCQRQSVCVCL